MRPRRAGWALPLLLAAQAALAQPLDLGAQVSSYTRFLVYPHLQKGFEALERGDRAQSIAEFGQARRLAPESPVIATYLAEAYRRFGDVAAARKLLQAELARFPGDARLQAALAALTPPPAPPAPRPTASAGVGAAAPSPAPRETATPAPNSSPASVRASAQADRSARAPAPRPVGRPAVVRAQGRAAAAGNRARRAAIPPGYRQADAAYQASARGDFKAAAAAAREAVRMAPDNADYRRLLAYTLLEVGSDEELQALAASAADERLTALAQQSRARQAYRDFERAGAALALGQAGVAAEHAERSVQRAPDVRAHWMQWAAALLAADRAAEAETALSQALTRLGSDDAELRVLRAHARQRQGDHAGAAADHDRALALATRDPLAQSLRLIAADAALAAGQPQRTLELLAPFAQNDTTVGYRRQLATSALQRSATPQPTVLPALAVPKVICVGSPFTAACDVWPGEWPPEAGQDSARMAHEALARQDSAQAVAHARQALAQAPRNARHRLLLLRALQADGQIEAALTAADDFLAEPPREPELLAQRSQIQARLNRPREALADADAALADPRLSVVSEIDLLLAHHPERARARLDAAQRGGELDAHAPAELGYLAVRVGDDAGALQAFERASAQGTLPDSALQDAGYAAGRLGRSDTAVGYFSRAIDAAQDGRLALTPQRLFETRREVADRSRTWGAIASLGYRGVAPGRGGAGQPATIGDSVQLGAELYWRPFGYGDGRYVELYGGGFQTLWAKDDAPSGSQTLQALAGVRAKPLRNANLVLSFERRIKVGRHAVNDWLLRAGYSYTYGTDLRVDVPQWTTAQLYAEAGRFLGQHMTYATAEAQLGRSLRLDALHPRLVLFPHLVLGADYNSRLASGRRDAFGAGAGLAVRYWFNETRYSAPRSYLDLSLQYRARLGGDERGKGVFVRATLVY